MTQIERDRMVIKTLLDFMGFSKTKLNKLMFEIDLYLGTEEYESIPPVDANKTMDMVKVWNEITCNGMREMTQERFGQAVKDIEYRGYYRAKSEDILVVKYLIDWIECQIRRDMYDPIIRNDIMDKIKSMLRFEDQLTKQE